MGKKDKAKSAKQGEKPEKATDAAGSLAFALTRSARAARTELTRTLSSHGLYAGQDTVITALAEGEAASPGAIAERLGVRAPTITKTINRLAAQGFVEKKSAAGDGRKAEIALTARGRETVEAIARAVAEIETAMLRDFTGKEAKTLAKLLRRAEKNLAQETVN